MSEDSDSPESDDSPDNPQRVVPNQPPKPQQTPTPAYGEYGHSLEQAAAAIVKSAAHPPGMSVEEALARHEAESKNAAALAHSMQPTSGPPDTADAGSGKIVHYPPTETQGINANPDEKLRRRR